MSNFTPLVKKEYEFEGANINVTFARLRRKHMLMLMPLIQKMGKARLEENVEVIAEISVETLNKMLDLLPEYVKKINGLFDKEGELLSIDDVADQTYFMDLATDIAMDLLDESTVLQGGDVKNG